MPVEPSSGEQSDHYAEELVFRRGKLRQRDDPAIDLFREAQANLADLAHVKPILLELSRLYNPVTNGPILDLVRRRRLVELLETGATEAARELLEQCVKGYTRSGDRKQR